MTLFRTTITDSSDRYQVHPKEHHQVHGHPFVALVEAILAGAPAVECSPDRTGVAVHGRGLTFLMSFSNAEN